MREPRLDLSAPAPEEEGLLRGVRAGEEQALEALVRTHGPRLLAVARRLLSSEEEARAAVQDAFLSAFRSIDRLEGTLSAWLHGLAVRASITRLVRRDRRVERPIEDLLPGFLEDGHSSEPAVEWGEAARRAVARHETRAMIRSSVDSLPESYRTVLILKDIEELDTAETAKLLDVDEGTVKHRLHRARQALQGLLDPHLREAFS